MFRTARPAAALATAVLVAGCVACEPMPLDRDVELAALRATTLDGLVVEHARPGERPEAVAARRADRRGDGADASRRGRRSRGGMAARPRRPSAPTRRAGGGTDARAPRRGDRAAGADARPDGAPARRRRGHGTRRLRRGTR